jgi:hypothetical protein
MRRRISAGSCRKGNERFGGKGIGAPISEAGSVATNLSMTNRPRMFKENASKCRKKEKIILSSSIDVVLILRGSNVLSHYSLFRQQLS